MGWFSHGHKWKKVYDGAIGYYEKQDGQKDSRIYVAGRADTCECGAWRLVPYEPGLQAVELHPPLFEVVA